MRTTAGGGPQKPEPPLYLVMSDRSDSGERLSEAFNGGGLFFWDHSGGILFSSPLKGVGLRLFQKEEVFRIQTLNNS